MTYNYLAMSRNKKVCNNSIYQNRNNIYGPQTPIRQTQVKLNASEYFINLLEINILVGTNFPNDFGSQYD